MSVCIVSGLGEYVLRIEFHQLSGKSLQRSSAGLEVVYSGVEATCKRVDILVVGRAFRRFGNMPVALALVLRWLAGDSYAFYQSARNSVGESSLTGAAVGGVALQGVVESGVGFNACRCLGDGFVGRTFYQVVGSGLEQQGGGQDDCGED